jgi:hypothetical protein
MSCRILSRYVAVCRGNWESHEPDNRGRDTGLESLGNRQAGKPALHAQPPRANRRTGHRTLPILYLYLTGFRF